MIFIANKFKHVISIFSNVIFQCIPLAVTTALVFNESSFHFSSPFPIHYPHSSPLNITLYIIIDFKVF